MAILDVRQSSGGRAIQYSMAPPPTVDIVLLRESLRHSQGSDLLVAPKLDSEPKINDAIDQLIKELEGVRKRARELLKAIAL